MDTEHELGLIEDEILGRELDKYPDKLNDIRSFLMDMRIHYEQMLDFGQELEENENGFFKEGNLRYFRLFTERVMRLMDQVKSLRDYTVQLRELFSTQLDIRMNRIMTVLTVVTVIFMPLTLIVGWRRLVRHELRIYAGTSLEIQLSGGLYRERAYPDRRRDLVPQEKMAVRTMF